MRRRLGSLWSGRSIARDGRSALEELARKPYDVIVSDMKMPGMDGPALLQAVQEQYPSVARIVLSGQAEREAVLRAVPVTHQFLSKPCDAEVLRSVIDRTCTLQLLLTDPSICRAAGRLTRLPSTPYAFHALNEALRQSHVSLERLAAIVEEDPAMTAKILQLVNSAYFGLPQAITSIPQAVMYLGVDLLRGLFVTARAFSMLDGQLVPGLSIERLQKHSLLTARVARRMAGTAALGAEAFTAGILHDIGRIVLSVGMPDKMTECLEASALSGESLAEAKHRIMGVSHAEVGAYLLGVWGLPFQIVETVAFHHRPGLVREGPRELLAIIHVADVLVGQSARGGAADSVGELDTAFLESGGWMTRLPEWRRLAEDELSKQSTAASEPIAVAAGGY